MTTYREFKFVDILKFNQPTLDPYIFAYSCGRYIMHLLEHTQFNGIVEHPNGEIMGYVVGKTDGSDDNFHAHVTSITVAPSFRRLGIGRKLLELVEDSSKKKETSYVDLFVRPENEAAIALYKSCDYKLHQVHEKMYKYTYDGWEFRKYFDKKEEKRHRSV